jgi:hypothetical protein
MSNLAREMDTGIELPPCGAKLAPTFAPFERLTRQVSETPLHSPFQPVNLLPAEAPARRVTFVPGLKLPKHFEAFAPHEMPMPVTVPAPETATERRAFGGATNLVVVVAAGSVAITGSTAGSVVVRLGDESPTGVAVVVAGVVVVGVVVGVVAAVEVGAVLEVPFVTVGRVWMMVRMVGVVVVGVVVVGGRILVIVGMMMTVVGGRACLATDA